MVTKNIQTNSKFILLLRIVVAGIFLQTLFFKFSGAEESKYIFSTLGVEPWGRILSGFIELIVCVLLLIPPTQLFGAIMGLGVIFGALMSHVFVLGLVVQDDGGLLFALASAIFIGCSAIIFLQRNDLMVLVRGLRK